MTLFPPRGTERAKRHLDPQGTSGAMSTRLCARCGREKTIRGVWYLTPARGGSTPFVCEACFSSVASLLNARA